MTEHPSLFADPDVSIEAKTYELMDRACEALIGEFQNVPTSVLKAIAEERDRIRKDGWMQRAIREYIEAWRG